MYVYIYTYTHLYMYTPMYSTFDSIYIQWEDEEHSTGNMKKNLHSLPTYTLHSMPWSCRVCTPTRLQLFDACTASPLPRFFPHAQWTLKAPQGTARGQNSQRLKLEFANRVLWKVDIPHSCWEFAQCNYAQAA